MSDPICPHCGQNREGFGSAYNLDVCHTDSPDRPDCYRRLTVYAERLGALLEARPLPAGIEDIRPVAEAS